MLRVVEQYSLTDVGRQRNANEDALFEAGGTPLFAVADGMGGARAGEVAAKAAVDEVAGLKESDARRRAQPGRGASSRRTGASTSCPSATSRSPAWARP